MDTANKTGQTSFSIVLSNFYLEAAETSSDDHYKCDVHSQVCEIRDAAVHVRLAAQARGEKKKNGIKILDLTLDEVKALAKDCEWQVYFTSAAHLQEDFKYTRNIHYGLKRQHERLLKLQQLMEGQQ